MLLFELICQRRLPKLSPAVQVRPLKRGLYALKHLHLHLGSLKLLVGRTPSPSPCAPSLEVPQRPLIQPPGAATSRKQPKLGQLDATGERRSEMIPQALPPAARRSTRSWVGTGCYLLQLLDV